MPLPIRPLSEPSSGEPAESKTVSPPAPVDDSMALPSLDFGGFEEPETEEELPGLPALDDDLYSGGLPPMEQSSAPAPTPQLDLPELPEDDLSDDEFDDLFNDFEETVTPPPALPVPAPTPPPLPPQSSEDDEFDDMDFDELFNEEDSAEDEAPLPAQSAEPALEADAEDDEDDWGFDDLEENSQKAQIDDFDDALFEEDADALPTMESSVKEQATEEDASPDSWEAEFEKFMDEDDEEDLEPKPSEDEEEEIPDDVLAPLKKEGKGKKKPKRKAKGGAKSQNPILRGLAAIPILGLIFRPLLKLGSIGVAILGLLPLLIIPLIIFLIAFNSVPGGNSITGADSAAASVSDFTLSDGQATATVTNSGEVVADVTTTFTVWSYNPLGGGSIFAFDEVGSCTADEVSVDIDASVPVTATCDTPAGGLMTKLSGSISY